MTLITRLGASFTDTSLPLLQKDPALPQSGGVMLVDFKSAGTYASQAANFSIGQQFSTLVSTNPVTQNYATALTGGTYDFVSGGAAANFELSPQTASPFLFDDVSHDYCFSIWLKLPSSPGNNLLVMQSPTGGSRSLQVRTVNPGAGLTSISLTHWGASAVAGGTSFSYFGNAVVRLGYAWRWSGSIWQSKSIVNNGVASNWTNITGLTNPNVGLYNTALGNPLQITVGSLSGALYRVLVEDITESGRTPEQVWDADWARGNGRFS